ncbi:MAG TPA: hypothetical protein VHC70_13110 [Phycisphaerales bacterium]|jgi:hypothetical protein|nr:hypothetical protein [Phycisphaerales bacterium]
MTRAHRRLHLAAWVVLSPAILGVLIAALVVRAQARAQVASGASHPHHEGAHP